MAAGESSIQGISFNQDHGCFACGMSNGFRIYNSDPVKLKQFRAFEDGGIGIVEMLFRCNYVGLVGGGLHPKAPATHLLVWDDQKKKCVIDIPFKSEIRAVRLRRDRIIAVLGTEVQVFTFMHSPQLLNTYDTGNNSKGICALSPHRTTAILAIPGRVVGQVQIVDLCDSQKAPSFIPAHETALACLAINAEGTLIATASEKGTLIRVFDTRNGKQVSEFRRGMDKATISCINFNLDSTMLCVSSDKCTVHVFQLTEDDFKRSSTMLHFFSNQKTSFAKFTVSSPNSICSFTPTGAIIAVGPDGSWYRFQPGLPDGASALPPEVKRYLELVDDGKGDDDTPAS